MKSKILVSTNLLFNEQSKLSKAYASIFNFAEQSNLKSQLVSIVSPDLLSWPTHFDDEWGHEFMRIAKKMALENLKEVEDRSQEPHELVLQTINSRKQSVRSIIEFAQNTDVALIAAITHLTHEEKLISFPGSFVETLVAESTLPVLVVNSQADPVQKFRKILVPTDFSKACKQDFKKVLEFAKPLNAQIDLIHVLTVPEGMDFSSASGLSGGWPRIESFIERVEVEAYKSATEFLAIAKEDQIVAEFNLIRNREQLSKIILNYAIQTKSDLIAMTNQTGPIASLLLGSMTRQLMRTSQIPLLVFPPHTH